MFELASPFDSFATLTKTTVVIRSRLARSSRDPVDSDFNATFSAIPPVKSLRPSKVVPYFNASYEPCSLIEESLLSVSDLKNVLYSHVLC